jgi:pimeloyl-ACP methyl ester carboxylesterase
MHGNASSQHEGQFLIPNLCPLGVALYCFDFAGCGASGGDFISLGHFETMDVQYLIENLIVSFGLGPFVLWGRSMGAATALLVRHPHVIGRIVDSAFSSIPDVCEAIALKLHMPSIFLPAALLFLKLTVLGRADFDLGTVSPLNSAKQPGAVPMLMCHAVDDEFIPISQGEAIFEAYSNPDKKLMRVSGGHNGRRSLGWIDEACRFALRLFGLDAHNFKAVRFVGVHGADQHFKSYDDLLRFMNTRGSRDSDIDSPIVERELSHIPDGGRIDSV